MIKLPKNKWAKFGLRLLLYIAILIALARLPTETKITMELEILHIYVWLIAIFDLVFTYYADYGLWKEEEDIDEQISLN